MNKMIWRDVLHVMSKVEACLLIGKGNAKFCLLNIHIYLFEWVYCLILLITQQQYTVVHLKIFFRINAWTKKRWSESVDLTACEVWCYLPFMAMSYGCPWLYAVYTAVRSSTGSSDVEWMSFEQLKKYKEEEILLKVNLKHNSHFFTIFLFHFLLFCTISYLHFFIYG